MRAATPDPRRQLVEAVHGGSIREIARAAIDASRAKQQALQSQQAPYLAGYEPFIDGLLAPYVTRPDGTRPGFAAHHRELWEWVWSLERGKLHRPFIAIWPRGGAKSTSAEMACVLVAARRTRAYGLYVSATQKQADDHVQSVSTMLEGERLGEVFPLAVGRDVDRFGQVRGWRRNRLWTKSGFVLDAMGMDSAIRGAKLGEERPDFIVIDDIDEEHDSLYITQKKIDTLTKAILAARSNDAAVLAIQNLILPTGIFARLAGVGDMPSADFLQDRIVSGPIPALIDPEYEMVAEDDELKKWTITAGIPTWDGQDVAACQGQMNTIGYVAFRVEAQHEIYEREGTLFKREWFSIVDEPPPGLRWVRYWDLATSSKQTADYTASVAVGIGTDGAIYLRDMIRGRWEWPDTKAIMKRTFLSERGTIQLVEKAIQGATAVQEFRRDPELANVTIQGVDVHRDKVTRALAWSARAEEGRVKLVRGEWITPFLHEVITFPDGTHDDQVDAVSGAMEALGRARWGVAA